MASLFLKMTWCSVMWILVFACVSTVGGVPGSLTHGSSTDNVTSVADASPSAAAGALTGGDVPVHVTPAPPTDKVTSVGDASRSAAAGALTVANVSLNDATALASAASSVFKPKNQSAEMLQGLEEDMAVQEGDILMSEDRNAVNSLWSDAILPYTISPELAHRKPDIQAAFKMITDHTCIRFHKRTNELNYVEFKDGKGCASFAGCKGGSQPLYCAESCTVGNVCHEIIHALGLHHEHTRLDRDQYVTVMWQSITPGSSKNFKIKGGDTQNLPYDMDSIMHYGPFYFSVDGNPTVVAKVSGGQMGQRTHLSHLDVQRLNKLYHCSERTKWYG